MRTLLQFAGYLAERFGSAHVVVNDESAGASLVLPAESAVEGSFAAARHGASLNDAREGPELLAHSVFLQRFADDGWTERARSVDRLRCWLTYAAAAVLTCESAECRPGELQQRLTDHGLNAPFAG